MCIRDRVDITNYSPYARSYHFPECPPSDCPNPSQSSGNASTSVNSGPFVVKFLNGRTKVCAGCKGPHLKGPNNELLPPPNNICIQHSEPLTFTNPRTGLEASKVGNAYYHINSACIHKKHPNFTASLVSCPEEVLKLMQPSHFKLLHDTLHFVMPCSTVTAFHAHCLPLTLYHLCYHLLIVLIICYPFYITAHAQ